MKTIGYNFLIGCFLIFTYIKAYAQVPPAPFGPTPTQRQLMWHDVEFYGLIHFTPTTFENKEWGYGDADPRIFHPTDFDADQIVKAAKAAGMRAIVLVAKHHDGFALWPTQTTDYSIANSPFRDGKGDMVKEFADAARNNGLKFGVYCSPWDRNNAAYGTPEYLTIYRKQLQELYTGYGELFMSWHDGANGGDGYYGGANEKRTIDNTTYYDWPHTWNELTRKLQPMANIFSDVGWDVRWVGNEKGIAAETHWATFTPQPAQGANQAVPGQANYEDSPTGHRDGAHWMPAECDVPLRKGWFFHPDEAPKSVEQLFSIYLQSVGRGAALDLGLAPDTRGLLSASDVAVLENLGKKIAGTFKTNLLRGANVRASNVRGYNSIYGTKNLTDDRKDSYWATDDDFKTPYLTISSANPITFDIFEIGEYIRLGQRIEGFSLETEVNGEWKEIHRGTSIGAKRLIKFENPITTQKIRLKITQCPVGIAINKVGAYLEAE